MPNELSNQRRRLLQMAGAVGGSLAAGLSGLAQAGTASDEGPALAVPTSDDAIAAWSGVTQPSTQVTLELPQVAEDGAQVPITVNSRLPGTREIMIVVEGNPQPVAVSFTIPDGTQPYVATRIRMARSATVCAVVRTDSGLFTATSQIQVTVSGCR